MKDKVVSCVLMSREEYYDVTVHDRNGVEVPYTIRYSKDTNSGWDSFDVLNEEGEEVPEGELRAAIIAAFETCDAH